MTRSIRNTNLTSSAILLLTLAIPSLAQLAGCGSADPVGQCNSAVDSSCQQAEPDCGEDPCDDDTAPPVDSGTPVETECDMEELAVAIMALEPCPAGTYFDYDATCINGDWDLSFTCVEMTEEEADLFDCSAALADVYMACDGTITAFTCNSTTGEYSSTCTPDETSTVDCAANLAVAATACTDGATVATLTCDGTTGSTVVVCDEPAEAVDVAECESAASVASGCEYGLASYVCDGTTGSVVSECADAPETAESGVDCTEQAAAADDVCGDTGVSTYECSSDEVSITCFEATSEEEDPEEPTDTDDLGAMSCCVDVDGDTSCDVDHGDTFASSFEEPLSGYNDYTSDLWWDYNSQRPICVEYSDGTDDGTDDDGDSYTEDEGDCNDGNDEIHPGADELCDGYDNDCDESIDNGSTATDYDGDGYYDPGCYAGGTDCRDGDSDSNPDASEACGDAVDSDCTDFISDVDEDGDGFAPTSCGTDADDIGSLDSGDCQDSVGSTGDWDNGDIHPGQIEMGDWTDTDCDGTADNGCSWTCTSGYELDGVTSTLECFDAWAVADQFGSPFDTGIWGYDGSSYQGNVTCSDHTAAEQTDPVNVWTPTEIAAEIAAR